MEDRLLPPPEVPVGAGGGDGVEEDCLAPPGDGETGCWASDGNVCVGGGGDSLRDNRKAWVIFPMYRLGNDQNQKKRDQDSQQKKLVPPPSPMIPGSRLIDLVNVAHRMNVERFIGKGFFQFFLKLGDDAGAVESQHGGIPSNMSLGINQAWISRPLSLVDRLQPPGTDPGNLVNLFQGETFPLTLIRKELSDGTGPALLYFRLQSILFFHVPLKFFFAHG